MHTNIQLTKWRDKEWHFNVHTIYGDKNWTVDDNSFNKDRTIPIVRH